MGWGDGFGWFGSVGGLLVTVVWLGWKVSLENRFSNLLFCVFLGRV